MKYKHRYIARIVIEAQTPLCVGTGKISMNSDSAVKRDSNGLPCIPGTSIVGVLRHSLAETTDDKDLVNRIFGFQQAQLGHGSTLICSSALMIGANGKVLDGLSDVDWLDPFYAQFRNLPIRQHVRINDKGHAATGGKFDEEIVYKGTRFCFEVELLSEDENNVRTFEDQLLPLLSSKTFRLGGGTRKGFGEIKVHSITQRYYNLTNSADLEAYLDKSSFLTDKFIGDKRSDITATNAKGWTLYEISLKPKDFFLFGSGFADEDADMTPVKEQIVEYDEIGNPSIKSHSILVPASSVKGAIAHRTAFYYNKKNGIFTETADKSKSNEAITSLFGSEKEIARGNVIFSDIYLPNLQDKLFNHVAIDRFTGGGIEGALYNEKATYANKNVLTLQIFVNESVTNQDALEAFESALDDLCTGYLPLGGCTNHGHGIFTGTKKVVKNGTIQ
jgi:CRISPR/Cas system CMR subunit Cmr4 (Cas7 group RAMP superfamily)